MSGIANRPLREFKSAQTAIVTSGAAVFSHNLGQKPKWYDIRLVCLASDAGYVAGDEVLYGSDYWWSSATSASAGCAIEANENELKLRFCNRTNVFALTNKADGGINVLDNSKWEIVVRAYA